MAKLVIDVVVDDKGNVQLKGIKGHVNDLDGTLKNLNSTANMVRNAFMSLVAALGIRELERAAEAWVRLSMAQEKSDNALKIAMLNNRQFSQEFLKSTMDQAMAIQRLTGVNRANVEEGQKMLMTYHRISTDQLPRATKVMADLASRSGDVFLAAKALGEASQGSARYLRNLGVAVDEEILKHKNFEEVLVILEKMLKDQAATLGMGYNKWNILGAMLDEVRKKAGDLFNEILIGSGVLPGAIESVGALVDSLNESFESGKFKEWALEVSQTFLQMAKAISGFLDIVYDLYVNKFEKLLDKAISAVGSQDFPEKAGNAFGWGSKMAGAGLMIGGGAAVTGGLSLVPSIALAMGGAATLGGIGSYLGYGLPTDKEERNAELERIDARTISLYREREESLAEINRLEKLMIETRKQSPDAIMLTPLLVTNLKVRIASIDKEFESLTQRINSMNSADKPGSPSKPSNYIDSKISEIELNLSNLRMQRIEKPLIDIGIIRDINKMMAPQGEWQTPNPVIGPSEEDLKAQEAAAKRAADALLALRDETARIKASTEDSFMADWGLLNLDYQKRAEKVTDKIALEEYYSASFDKIKDKEQARQNKAIDIQQSLDKIDRDLFNDKVKMREQYEATIQKLTDTRLNREKQAAEQSRKTALDVFNIQMDKLNPIFNQGEIDKYLNNAKQAMSSSKDIQIKIVNQQYIEQLKIIERNVFDIDEAQKQITELNQERADRIKAIENDWLKEQEEIIKKANKMWIDLADNLSNTFRDAFRDILAEGKLDFDKLGKSIVNVFVNLSADIAKQSFIKPLIDQVVSQTFGVQVGNYVPSNFVGPLAPGQKYASPYAGAIGAGSIGMGIGGIGGALGGAGGFLGGSALAAGGGTLAGMTVAGPAMLAAAGIALGSFLTGAFESEDVKIPNAKIIYEVIDGELKKIGERWKDTARDSGLVDSVTSFFDAQILFYDRLSTITGQKMADMKLSVGGRGIGEIASEMEAGMTTAVFKLALANYEELATAFGKDFTDQFEKLYGKTFSGVKTKTTLWGMGSSEKAPTLEDVAGNPEQINKLISIYDQYYRTMHTMAKEESPFTNAMGSVTGENWENLLQPFIDQLTEIWTTLSGDLGSAFLGSLSTGEFKDFEQQFKASIFQGVSESIAQAFMSKAMDIVMGPESGIFASLSGANNLLSDFISGKEGVTIQDVMGGFSSSFVDISNVMGELKPVWSEINTGMQNLAQVLGLNTEAVSKSTKQAYEEFMSNLKYGDLNPSQSTAGMMEEYNRLYSAALLDPEQFSKLAAFTGGSYLPGLKGINTETNYAGAYSGVVSQMEGLPTAWYGPTDDTASAPIVNPGDYSSASVTGQTQGPGFKQMMKEALQEVVQEKLAAMLKDIADAAREDSTTTGEVAIKGDIGVLMIKSIKTNPDVRMTVHNS